MIKNWKFFNSKNYLKDLNSTMSRKQEENISHNEDDKKIKRENTPSRN